MKFGDEVTVRSPGHARDGKTGKVTYTEGFWGTVGVSIDGEVFGFFPTELEFTKD